MAEVVKLMGIESRDWTDKTTGEVKNYTALHVVYEMEDEPIAQGNRVESFSCPRDVNAAKLKIGDLYELEWTHYKTKNGTAARICDLRDVTDQYQQGA